MIAFLGLGAASVAIATSVSSWLNFFWLGYFLNKDTPWMSKSLLTYGGKVLLATAAASLATLAFHGWLWGSFPALNILHGLPPVYAASLTQQIRTLLLDGGVFLSALAGSGYLLTAKKSNRYTGRPSS
jgi:putative peptidoglycan lipid II flippase